MAHEAAPAGLGKIQAGGGNPLRAEALGGDHALRRRRHDSNTVERSIRPIALNRKNALLASLIETCKLNAVEPQAYLADALTKLVNDWPMSRIDDATPLGLHHVPESRCGLRAPLTIKSIVARPRTLTSACHRNRNRFGAETGSRLRSCDLLGSSALTKRPF